MAEEIIVRVDVFGKQGPQGRIGPQGFVGLGQQGPQGPSGIGSQGPQGPPGSGGGAQGSQGPIGPQGPAGSGEGSQGAQGPQGISGPQGSQGPAGSGEGSQGAQGPSGPQGAQGPAGSGEGSQGAQGPQGPQGPAGSGEGSQGAQGPQGPQGPAGTQGGQFIPQNVYWVSPSWPPGVDPNSYFTTVTSAISAAAAAAPAINYAPSVVKIAPGDYTAEGVINLASSVNLSAWSPGRTVRVAGVAWTPASGINAPQAALVEEVSVDGIETNGFTVNASLLPANSPAKNISVYNSSGVNFGYTGSALPNSVLVAFDGVDWSDSVSFVDANYGTFDNVDVTNDVNFAFQDDLTSPYVAEITGFTVGGNFSQEGGNIQAYSMDVSGDYSVGLPGPANSLKAKADGAALITGSRVGGTTRAASPPSAIDIRASKWQEIAGPGTIDRSIDNNPTGGGSVGVVASNTPQPVNLAVAYPDGNYGVTLTPANATAINTIPSITNKQPGGFTLNPGPIPSGAGYRIIINRGSSTNGVTMENLVQKVRNFRRMRKQRK